MRKRNQPENHYINKKTAMHHHTENESSLFSCLVSTLPSSLLSLSLSYFSASVCLCLCLCLRVLLRVGVRGLCGVCVCFVWCGVRAPRAHVETHVRVVPETHGDALNVHTVTFFIGKTCDFDIY